jgi:nucleotide-binding universal stress UspA family protein
MKILAATDGSRGGSAAVRFADRVAGDHGDGELIVMTVARPSPGAESGDETRRHAEKILEAAARQARRSRGRAQFAVVAARPGSPIPETISREAERLKADLVVVGSEGRDTLNEWVLGGTALRLVFVSRRPVTVVRPPRRRKSA